MPHALNDACIGKGPRRVGLAFFFFFFFVILTMRWIVGVASEIGFAAGCQDGSPSQGRRDDSGERRGEVMS